jgi:hypothetical protein
MKRTMRQPLLCITSLSILWIASVGYAHSSGVPLVDLTITLDKNTLTYAASVPTFAFEPMKDIELGDQYVSLTQRKKEIEDFIAAHCPVKIDGIEVRPVLTWLDLFGPEKPIEEEDASEIEPSWAEAYMTLTYSTKGKPQQVSMKWTLFTGKAIKERSLPGMMAAEQAMASRGSVDSDKTMPKGMSETMPEGNPDEVIAVLTAFGRRKFVSFTVKEPEYIWHADGNTSRIHLAVVPKATEETIRVPIVPIAAGVLLLLFWPIARAAKVSRPLSVAVVSIVIVAGVAGQGMGRIEMKPFWRDGIEMPDPAEASEIFAALHRNVYRAFDYETEDAIYDALAQSVSGELLDEVYNDVYQGLILREEGGAICKIEQVEILDSSMVPMPDPDSENPQFKISCSWRVLGLVEHWGHAHRRINEYRAVYTLTFSGDKWKISDVEMSDQKRITGKKE